MSRGFSMVILVSGAVLLSSGQATTQGQGPTVQPVNGSGTPGTVPVWTESGKTLSDSLIQSNGSAVTVSAPLRVFGRVTMNGGGGNSAVAGLAGIGLSASGTGRGLIGNGSGAGSTGVNGNGGLYGVLGISSEASGWGVKGIAQGANGVGVSGHSPNVGVIGQSKTCDDSGCVPTAGDAGQFVAGLGGTLLHGFLANFDGPGGWDEKFKVDTSGNLYTYGNAYKPSGGSWAFLSDRRTKKSIEPIHGALNQLLQLHGVTFEYSNPSAVHELPGEHVGMVAQDVEQVFPSWVDTRDDGYKTLTFRGFEAVAVEAVRELDTKVESNAKESAARIEKLERENAELKRSLEALMEKLNSR